MMLEHTATQVANWMLEEYPVGSSPGEVWSCREGVEEVNHGRGKRSAECTEKNFRWQNKIFACCFPLNFQSRMRLQQAGSELRANRTCGSGGCWANRASEKRYPEACQPRHRLARPADAKETAIARFSAVLSFASLTILVLTTERKAFGVSA